MAARDPFPDDDGEWEPVPLPAGCAWFLAVWPAVFWVSVVAAAWWFASLINGA